jgi:predicted Rossmann fold flavoprotein
VIVVVGAGAAGLMAAIHAARAGARVQVLERTADGGRKILISGGGRCNVLPAAIDPRRFVTDSSPHTLRRLLLAWPLEAQRAFFETDLGLPLVLELETGKLFPRSNRARDVRDGLIELARRAGADLRFGTAVRGLERAAGGWRVRLDRGEPIAARAVVLATGGLSVPNTGSDGIGLTIARDLGHPIHPTYPALTPLTAEPAVHASLAGVSLEVGLRGRQGKRTASARGGFLFTHRGYSGPAILDLSHLVTRHRLLGEERPSIEVQWGAPDQKTWEATLRRQSTQLVATPLREWLPHRLVDRLLEETGVPADRTLAQLRSEERAALIRQLDGYQLPWSGDEGYRKAEVTGGGVALSAVDPRTLESRVAPGLYFCGEILDAFGPIGGHNFAWAWSTGRTAGEAARQRGQ